MNVLGKLGDMFASSAVTSVGNGIGSLMDRAGFVKKMSEAEKIEKTVDIIKATSKLDELDVEDMKSARAMAIRQMETQKASWIVRQLNGALRPVAGWLALICLTNKVWGQLMDQFVKGFVWEPIVFSNMESCCIMGIMSFFFAIRQRSKEKNISQDG